MITNLIPQGSFNVIDVIDVALLQHKLRPNIYDVIMAALRLLDL